MSSAIRKGINCGFRECARVKLVLPAHCFSGFARIVSRTICSLGLARLFRLPGWKDERGFVLIEVAIAMMIFGLILGPGFAAWRTHNNLRKHRITLYHQKLIFQALAQHLEQNGGLPFPSPLSSSVWGESIRPSDNTAPLKPGIVPYRSLGLPIRVAKDGFGHWMTYAVDVNLICTGVHFQKQLCEKFFKNPSALDVVESGKSVNSGITDNNQRYKPTTGLDGKPKTKPRFDGIAVILVSHGHAGWGAPLSQGQRIPFPTNIPDAPRMNGNDGLTFWASSQTDKIQPITHVVVAWKTRGQMISDAHLTCMDFNFEKEIRMEKEPNVMSGFPPNSNFSNSPNSNFSNSSTARVKNPPHWSESNGKVPPAAQ